jgi:uncharacterized protein (TIGR00255 family)
MKSMTGFGSARIDTPGLKASVQMKSWNNRYLEISLLMPSYLMPLDRPIRDFIESRMARGKVEVSVRMHGGDVPTEVSIDESSAKAVVEALRSLGTSLGMDEPVRISHILGIDGILAFERKADMDALWLTLSPVLEACVNAFNLEREREGTHTRHDLEQKLEELKSALEIIEAVAPGLETAIKASLRKKFEEVMGDLVDEARLLSEIASYLAKHTVNEEIVRLRSHIKSFESTMNESVCGKKLDFICQEINREANTIGSKSASADVSDAVIRMKDAVENIREQIRNIE